MFTIKIEHRAQSLVYLYFCHSKTLKQSAYHTNSEPISNILLENEKYTLI